MNDVQSSIVSLIRSMLEHSDKADIEITLDTQIHGEGLALDSLETAELSASLEDQMGSDPFSAGLMPATVAEIVAFYEADGASGPAAISA